MPTRFLLLLIFIVLTSCDEGGQNNDPVLEIKKRDSIYLKVREFITQRKFSEAEGLLDIIKASGMFDHYYYYHGANVKIGLQKYSEAIHLLSTAIRISTKQDNIAAMYYVQGTCYSLLNLPDSAIKMLNIAIELDSNNAGYICARIKYNLRGKLPALALDDANRLVRLDTANLDYWSYVGLCKYEFGDTIGATDIYKFMLKKNPGDLNALKSLGFINLNKNNLKSAKTYFQKYIDIEPTNGEVFFGMAVILSNENKKDDACDYILKAIEYGSPKSPTAMLGFLLFSLLGVDLLKNHD